MPEVSEVVEGLLSLLMNLLIIEFRAEPEVAVTEGLTTAPPPAARSAAGARP